MRDAYRNRMPIPEKFRNAPELLPGLGLYFTAYEELVSFRLTDKERRPILWADVHEYAKHFHFNEDQRAALLYHVAAMERAYTNWMDKKSGRGRGKDGPNKTKPALAKNSRAK